MTNSLSARRFNSLPMTALFAPCSNATAISVGNETRFFETSA
jgi:hypothetical protein